MDSDLSLLLSLELSSYPSLVSFLNLHYFSISLYDTLAYWLSTFTTFSKLSQDFINHISEEPFNVHTSKICSV